jgi:hypothetical protein
MHRRSSTARIVALTLSLTLPGVAAARLAIDLRAPSQNEPGVEARHDARCSGLHDHRLCTLLFRANWSPGPSTPAVTAVAIISRDFPLPALPAPLQAVKWTPVARSPPLPL